MEWNGADWWNWGEKWGSGEKKWRKNLVMSKKGCNFALAIERLAERCNLSRRSLG